MASTAMAGKNPASTGTPAQPSVWLKLTHGFGSSALGIKEGGFSYFLLLFYGTVVGLEPGLVGLAILIALVVDAISDPLVGYWSDNFRSRWGRRHPFMYASAVPVGLSYFLLWNPPEWSQMGLFLYLTGLAIIIRTFITFYETPSSALLPELSSDYEERTSNQSFRFFFAWASGNVLSVLMFGVLLAGPLGMQDRSGYETYGILASCIIFAAIVLSSMATHHRIPTLSKAPPASAERFSLVGIMREMFDILRERSFVALFLATILFAMATGLNTSLAFLMLKHFWGLSEHQIFIWTATVFVSAGIALVIGPVIGRKLGKKRGALVLGLLAFTIQPAPYLLRLAGLMPENGDPVLFPLILSINVIDLALIIAVQILAYAMVADLVESNQLRTGKRNEGVYYAAMTFTRKSTQGLGVLAAGLILSAVAFPQGEDLISVAPDTLWNLGALYAPSLLALWMSALFCLSRYKIDKAQHEANLAALSSGQS